MTSTPEQFVILFATASSKDEAGKIARDLLENRLIACANLIENIHSLFWWEGKIDAADEVLLIMKSTKDRVGEVIDKIRSLHSYDVPEIIALPLGAGNSAYLDWIRNTVA